MQDMVEETTTRIKQAQEKLKQIKNPTATPNPKETKPNTKEMDEINNILADVLEDVGLADKAPQRKGISPDVTFEKNIQTRHKSNLWENLAKKHDMDLVVATEHQVIFYDNKHKTPIRFHIDQNKEWIDYTNKGKKSVNIEDFLKHYNSSSTIQKKATPIVNIKGENGPEQGNVRISRNTFELNIYRSGYHANPGDIGAGNLKHAMHHEMWHCVDLRLVDEFAARRLDSLASNEKGSIYKKAVSKDRRNRKKLGGYNFISEYARQSGSGNKVFEDFAEAGALYTSDTYVLYKRGNDYIKLTKKEFKKKYPNRYAVIEDLVENGKLLW
jgi:hypothetical protein